MKLYKIQARVGAFRRAGYRFTRAITEISEEDLTDAQISALENEPRLIVSVSKAADEAAKKKAADEAAKKKAADEAAKKTPAKK